MVLLERRIYILLDLIEFAEETLVIVERHRFIIDLL